MAPATTIGAVILIVAQSGHKGDGLPASERNAADHPLAPWRPPVEPHQVRADRRLVDKHQPGGIKHALLSHPTSASSRHICALPLGSLQAFLRNGDAGCRLYGLERKAENLCAPMQIVYEPGPIAGLVE